MEKAEIIERICHLLARGDDEQAKKVARDEYPFQPLEANTRRYSETEMVRVFVRDGFIDRFVSHI